MFCGQNHRCHDNPCPHFFELGCNIGIHLQFTVPRTRGMDMLIWLSSSLLLSIATGNLISSSLPHPLCSFLVACYAWLPAALYHAGRGCSGAQSFRRGPDHSLIPSELHFVKVSGVERRLRKEPEKDLPTKKPKIWYFVPNLILVWVWGSKFFYLGPCKATKCFKSLIFLFFAVTLQCRWHDCKK